MMQKSQVKRLIVLTVMMILSAYHEASAQFIIGDVINMTVTRVIKAIDLKVQRMQNKTIWLQDAQKSLENEMARIKLTEISGWSAQQKDLYSNYYTELWKIKSVIAGYQRIKDIMQKQVELVSEYKRAWSMFRQDRHFNAQELDYMQRVYTGILASSAHNLDQLMLVVSPLKTQMSDEQRLEMINKAGDQLDGNYNDLHRFNDQGIRLSLERSKDINDNLSIKKLYGIN